MILGVLLGNYLYSYLDQKVDGYLEKYWNIVKLHGAELIFAYHDDHNPCNVTVCIPVTKFNWE
jgi:hypothetical protein